MTTRRGIDLLHLAACLAALAWAGCGCPTGTTSCGDACVVTDNDPRNCGACGTACTDGQFCVAGKCQLVCAGGTTLCGTACVNTRLDPANCGGCGAACKAGEVCSAGKCGVECRGGTKLCGAKCADTTVDPANCGACGTVCTDGQVCSAGACGVECAGGTTKCGSVCVNVQNDPANCGGCGTACKTDEVCSGGKCALSCVGGTTFCGGVCVNTQNDPGNCGGCSIACKSGEVCSSGACGLACAGGTTKCGSACTNTEIDAANCGTCGNACTGGKVCSGGICGTSCSGGTTLCGGACTNTQTDPMNCGACGTVCPSSQSCSAGKCGLVCVGGSTFCGGACVNTLTDDANCGGCNQPCGNGLRCIGGACALASQSVSLIAGTLGSPGNLNGLGTAARFYTPNGIAADGSGNLFVADRSNCVIRKVILATGATSTFAGTLNACGEVDGVGSGARFNGPMAIVFDGVSRLFVTDHSGHTVRQILITTGQVTTIAGLGNTAGCVDGQGNAARFTNPEGIAFDGVGTLAVADAGSHTVRRVTLSSGAVTTLAGACNTACPSGACDGTALGAQFRYPRGVAYAGGTLYVADSSSHTLRAINLADSAVTTVAGTPGAAGGTNGTGAAARFSTPIGLFHDGAGNLYIADYGNNLIRKMVLAGAAVSTVAGTTTAGYTDATGFAAQFANPRFVGACGAGTLCVGDETNHAIRSIALGTGAVTTLAGLGPVVGAADGTGASATFNQPYGLVSDGNDTLWLTDSNNHTVRKVIVSSGVVTTLAGQGGVAGNVDGTAMSARFSRPWGLASDGTSLYVADYNNSEIRKVAIATGAVTTLAGVPGSAGYADGPTSSATLRNPIAVAWDGGTNLYVGDFNNCLIRVISLSGNTVSTLAGCAPGNTCNGVTGGCAVTDGIATNARFANINGLVADKAGGALYVNDSNRIRQILIANGTVVTLSGTGGYSDGYGVFGNISTNTGTQLTFDGAGNLYVPDLNNHVIRKVNLNAGNGLIYISTVFGTYGQFGWKLGQNPTSIYGPRAIALLKNGSYAFAAVNGVFLVK